MKKVTIRFLPVFLILLLLNSFFYVVDAAAQSQKTFMWKVRSQTSTVYVLGSVHFMKKEVYPLNNKIEDAFEKSNVLAVEANINDAAKLDLQKLLASAIYQGNETLESHISKETYELLKKETALLGMPIELISKQKPWFLSLTLTSMELMKLGFNPQYGIDTHFLKKAAGKKKIVELESIDYQINLLSGFPDSEQELFLLHTLKDLKKIKQETDKLLQSWLAGDAKGIEAIASRANGDGKVTKIYEKLYYERKRWTPSFGQIWG
ncbi:MAG: TraB/GumN family protein [Nitrospiraceae bacterium]|nr:MAG: TraB/GumN family protein [Nitrospiraceae bacterium]